MRLRWRSSERAAARRRRRVAGARPARSSEPGEGLEVVGRRVVDLDVALAQEVLQLRQVAAVGRDGVPRGAALEREVREEVRDRIHAGPFAPPPPVPSQRCGPLHEHPRRRESHRAGRRHRSGSTASRSRSGSRPACTRPRPFTQALVTALPRVDGLDVIDAGCGAGAVTVALLRRGAAHVSAWDIVPAAIDDTLENVSAPRRSGARRPRTSESFDGLADVPADLLVTNPPQRPRAVWEQLPADARGVGAGGEDGLEELESSSPARARRA